MFPCFEETNNKEIKDDRLQNKRDKNDKFPPKDSVKRSGLLGGSKAALQRLKGLMCQLGELDRECSSITGVLRACSAG